MNYSLSAERGGAIISHHHSQTSKTSAINFLNGLDLEPIKMQKAITDITHGGSLFTPEGYTKEEVQVFFDAAGYPIDPASPWNNGAGLVWDVDPDF